MKRFLAPQEMESLYRKQTEKTAHPNGFSSLPLVPLLIAYLFSKSRTDTDQADHVSGGNADDYDRIDCVL
ncbi:hypothetical protein QQP08_026044 [Theobroma cacao]|uniref:Uncharacterized protein n=1 Tax=Theobroma cacao TaxID=3641 RepID=A0A061GVY9_THECC|nr:Uncharacterized protein TCM_041299 [Theobroma cacao]WRX31932.1 hypothetical protein QQP08_024419 [Theobroma cacao]WRX33557.1 hypothetical protein QQP08_026044 [Theobroma cacao]